VSDLKNPVVLVTADFTESELARLRQFAEVRVGGWGVTGVIPGQEELIELLQGVDILAVSWESITEEVLEASNLQYIASVRGGPGGNIDLEAVKRRGIPVTGTLGREAIPVAEFAIGLMIGLSRFIPETAHRIRTGELTSSLPQPPGDLGWGMNPGDPWIRYRGQDLYRKTLGLVGLGAVGKLVAARASAFGMTVRAYDPYVQTWEGVEMLPLNEVMGSDIVSMHSRYSTETHHLVGREQLRHMPKHGLLVNTARPNLVDRDALLEALQQGQIAGAALDVHAKEPLDPDDPFLELPNVLLTPHIAGSSHGVTQVQSEQVVDNIRRFLDGNELETRVA
jgi:D-3-phosphoglycerate dehydrogenase